MSTILKENIIFEDVENLLNSTSHFLQSGSIILSMSDVKIWLKDISFSEVFNSTEIDLCEVSDGQIIYSEEGTKIFK